MLTTREHGSQYSDVDCNMAGKTTICVIHSHISRSLYDDLDMGIMVMITTNFSSQLEIWENF